ncbi:hypothetical protein [Mucilaginibacter lappiensis]|uniref:Uncharacterized protein n=1 Tax=Mucilaginibacter lappiensis TaxID=354630 RepID=A0A841JH67_9SPHI|nr:hypothetical protein [Mucilaginibacter lappiensis]MBB6130240.1 hypothetical protein [Mucilaginibacter lappiensis]
MKNPIVITLLFLSCTLLVKAQDVKKTQAQPDSIIKLIPFGEGRHTDYLFTIGGKLQTAEDVKIRLLAYAPSAMEFQKAKTQVTWGVVASGGAVASSIVAIIQFIHHGKDDLDNMPTAGLVNGKPGFIYPPQHHSSLTGAYILTGAAVALLVTSFVHFVKAGKYGNKAVKVYNLQYQ